MSYKKVKPLFKYIGGKSWLRETLRENVAQVLKRSNIRSYCEPFCGGLGAFLSVYDILHTKNINKVILNDVNNNLINLYEQIKSNPQELMQAFSVLEEAFIKTIPKAAFSLKDKNLLKEKLKKAQVNFVKVRTEFNKNKSEQNSIEQAARLMFLQKHAFNGIYRENSKGEHNTPFNWAVSTTSQVISQRIEELHEVFQMFEIEFTNQSFESLDYNQETLYYLDPPYLNERIMENKYHKEAFGLASQLKLIESITPTHFIYSNHDNVLLREKFKSIKGVEVKTVSRSNLITSDKNTRSNKVLELFVIRSLKNE